MAKRSKKTRRDKVAEGVEPGVPVVEEEPIVEPQDTRSEKEKKEQAKKAQDRRLQLDLQSSYLSKRIRDALARVNTGRRSAGQVAFEVNQQLRGLVPLYQKSELVTDAMTDEEVDAQRLDLLVIPDGKSADEVVREGQNKLERALGKIRSAVDISPEDREIVNRERLPEKVGLIRRTRGIERGIGRLRSKWQSGGPGIPKNGAEAVAVLKPFIESSVDTLRIASDGDPAEAKQFLDQLLQEIFVTPTIREAYVLTREKLQVVHHLVVQNLSGDHARERGLIEDVLDEEDAWHERGRQKNKVADAAWNRVYKKAREEAQAAIKALDDARKAAHGAAGDATATGSETVVDPHPNTEEDVDVVETDVTTPRQKNSHMNHGVAEEAVVDQGPSTETETKRPSADLAEKTQRLKEWDILLRQFEAAQAFLLNPEFANDSEIADHDRARTVNDIVRRALLTAEQTGVHASDRDVLRGLTVSATDVQGKDWQKMLWEIGRTLGQLRSRSLHQLQITMEEEVAAGGAFDASRTSESKTVAGDHAVGETQEPVSEQTFAQYWEEMQTEDSAYAQELGIDGALNLWESVAGAVREDAEEELLPWDAETVAERIDQIGTKQLTDVWKGTDTFGVPKQTPEPLTQEPSIELEDTLEMPTVEELAEELLDIGSPEDSPEVLCENIKKAFESLFKKRYGEQTPDGTIVTRGEQAGFTGVPGVRIDYISNEKRGSKSNEDRVVVSADGLTFAVIDGMGGAGNGDVVADVLAAHVAAGEDADVYEAVVAAQRELFHMEKVGRINERSGACFATGEIKLNGEDVVLDTMHMGDVRIVVRRADGTLEFVSKDFSLVQEMVDAGMITEDAALYHNDRNIVSSAVTARCTPRRNDDLYGEQRYKIQKAANNLIARGMDPQQVQDAMQKAWLELTKDLEETDRIGRSTVLLREGDEIFALTDGYTDNFTTEEWLNILDDNNGDLGALDDAATLRVEVYNAGRVGSRVYRQMHGSFEDGLKTLPKDDDRGLIRFKIGNLADLKGYLRGKEVEPLGVTAVERQERDEDVVEAEVLPPGLIQNQQIDVLAPVIDGEYEGEEREQEMRQLPRPQADVFDLYEASRGGREAERLVALEAARRAAMDEEDEDEVEEENGGGGAAAAVLAAAAAAAAARAAGGGGGGAGAPPPGLRSRLLNAYRGSWGSLLADTALINWGGGLLKWGVNIPGRVMDVGDTVLEKVQGLFHGLSFSWLWGDTQKTFKDRGKLVMTAAEKDAHDASKKKAA
ncbi:TPA: hypothetical protein DEB00_03740 [Candidatus Uhrbacteria bacterium]|nr:hypothetical protein [Candidatus Uhrbacteria bacterium]